MKKVNIKNSGYSGGGASRDKNTLKSFLPRHWSAKSDIDYNLETLRSRAADLVMNSPLGSAAINTSTANVISSGLKVYPRLKARELGLTAEEALNWSRRTKLEFELWAKSLDCDYYRRNNFAELQRIAYISYLTDGDCFCIFRRRYPTRDNPYTLRLQLIESARVSNPQNQGLLMNHVEAKNPANGNQIVNGIEVDRTGQLQAIWVSNKIWNEPDLTTPQISWQRVKIFGSETGKRNVLHICNDVRTEQFRGVPYLAPVIESLKQVSRYADAELTSSIIKSFFSIFFTQNVNASAYDLNQILPEDGDDELDKVMREYKLGAGTITALPRGVDVKAVDRSNSQSTFEPFVSSFVKQVGASLGIPYEVLLKNFQSSYSASRAALLQSESEFNQRREAFIQDFCQPIYENFLVEAIALGRIQAEGFFDDPLKKSLWTTADWYCEMSKVLDPVKEIQGAQMRIALGLSTRQKEAAQMNGLDFFENVDELKLEESLLKENLQTQYSLTEN